MNAYHFKASARIAKAHLDSFVPIGAHEGSAVIAATVAELWPGGAALTELTDSQRALVNCLLLQTTGQTLRYTLSGTNPSASFGFILPVNQAPLKIILAPGVIVKVIETVATATIHWQYGVISAHGGE